MSTTLTDRYVAAILKHLPRNQQADIELELRTAISDEVDSRVAAGEKPANAEYDTLRALGDPGTLAARYHRGRQALIGSHSYHTWSAVMRITAASVLPVVFVVLIVSYALSQHNIWITIFRPIGITMTVGAWLFTAVTGVFALADGRESKAASRGLGWTPDRLRYEEQ